MGRSWAHSYDQHAETCRRAAAERCILPREMQSITWEAVRGLFSPSLKGLTDKATGVKINVAKTDKVWKTISLESSHTMTQDNKSSRLQAELKALHGTDPVLDHLLKKGPVTRQSYLEYAYPDGVPDPMPAELEGEIPKPLQLDTASSTHGMNAPAPVRTDFESQDDFEEAMSRWRWTVGRNKAIAALTSNDSQPK